MSIDFQPEIMNKVVYPTPRQNNANNNNNNKTDSNNYSSSNQEINNLNSRHFQIQQQWMSPQQMVIPPAATVKLFSKKLLQTSDLANRFLFHVSETEKARQRIKQRKKTDVPDVRDEEKKMFTIIGSEIVGIKKKLLASKEDAAGQQRTTVSPAVSSLSLGYPTTPVCPAPNEQLVPAGSPLLSPRRDRTNVSFASAPTPSPLELVVAYNEAAGYLPQIHTAAFFPRRLPLHSNNSNNKRLGTMVGISSLKMSTKPCAFCPNNHSTSASSSVLTSPSPQLLPRRSVNNGLPGHNQYVVKNTNSAGGVEHCRMLPNIILHFNLGIQPTVVPPPTMPNKKKPWNWPRRFDPTVSPNQSRLSTAIAIRSISTADIHRMRQDSAHYRQANQTTHLVSRGLNDGQNNDDDGTILQPENAAILNHHHLHTTINNDDDNNSLSTAIVDAGANSSEQAETDNDDADTVNTAEHSDNAPKLHVTVVKIR